MLRELFLPNKLSRNRSAFHKDLNSAVLLGLILLLGTVLRFYDLGAESYWGDEMYTVIEGQQSVQQLITSGRLDQPPAYYLPFLFWVRIFGTAEVSTRSFSALAGIGSIIIIYLIGRELVGKEVGLLSAFMMAISEFQIYYSQIARFYSFFELMTLLSFLFFILALKSGKKIHLVFYGIANILMLYSHTYGVFILVAQSIFLIFQWKKYKSLVTSWLICQMLVGLAFAPYFYLLVLGYNGIEGAAISNMTGNHIPSLQEPLRTIYKFIMPLRRERSWISFLAIYAGAGALLVAGTWLFAGQQRKNSVKVAAKGLVDGLKEVPGMTSILILLCFWLVFPILLPFILAMLIGPFYAERYLISAAPALYLFLAFVIYFFRKIVPVIVVIGALVILVAPGLYGYYVTDVNEQWKEAAAYVRTYSRGDEVIVIAPGNINGAYVRTFDWYYQGITESCGIPGSLVEHTAISDALKQCVSGHNRFWVIRRDSAGDVQSYVSTLPDQTDLHMLREKKFVEISVYLFELQR